MNEFLLKKMVFIFLFLYLSFCLPVKALTCEEGAEQIMKSVSIDSTTDLTNIYYSQNVVRNVNYPANALDINGNDVGGKGCTTRPGCTAYLSATSYDETLSYFKLNTCNFTPPPTEPEPPQENTSLSTFFTIYTTKLTEINNFALNNNFFLGFVVIIILFIILEIFLSLFKMKGRR